MSDSIAPKEKELASSQPTDISFIAWIFDQTSTNCFGVFTGIQFNAGSTEPNGQVSFSDRGDR